MLERAVDRLTDDVNAPIKDIVSVGNLWLGYCYGKPGVMVDELGLPPDLDQLPPAERASKMRELAKTFNEAAEHYESGEGIQ